MNVIMHNGDILKTKLFILLFAGITAFIITKGVGQKGVDQTYLLPIDFEGCVVIHYDQKNAPPLQIVNHEITYSVPNDGVIRTSSPMEFGWVNKNSSGAYRTRAFYVDRYGNKISVLLALYRNMEFQNKNTFIKYLDQEVEDRGCPQIDG